MSAAHISIFEVHSTNPKLRIGNKYLRENSESKIGNKCLSASIQFAFQRYFRTNFSFLANFVSIDYPLTQVSYLLISLTQENGSLLRLKAPEFSAEDLQGMSLRFVTRASVKLQVMLH